MSSPSPSCSPHSLPSANAVHDLDIDSALVVALDAAKAGCAVLSRGRSRLAGLRTATKSPGDITTELDARSEAAIFARIRQAYPEHARLGEETGEGAGNAGASPYRWIVDPLDGTVNYVHGIPYYAVSVALEVDGAAVLGVVADPARREFFTAVRGGGAFCNGRPLKVAGRARMDEAVIGTVVPPPKWPGMEAYLAQFCAVARCAAGMRRGGAAALDLAYVAAGRLDGFFVVSLKRWDLSAGALLVQEAGGCVADIDGHPDPLHANRLAAANGALLPVLLERLRVPA
nr:inositol-1-monophosphatase [Nitratidesulfovibrio sp. HK-II]